MRVVVSYLLVLFWVGFSGLASALEYLSDSELANLDGYTSSFMLKEYDDDGNVIFRRGDSEPCRYGQSDESDDVRMRCENAFEQEYDRIISDTFQRYLDQALVLMKADPKLDTPGDKVQELNLSIRLDDFDYNHFMCDGMPEKGVIRFEGISIRDIDGSDLEIGPVRTTIEDVNNVNTGMRERVIVSETPAIRGFIGVDHIRIGTSVEDAKSSPSLGSFHISDIGPSTMRISRTR